eukprot:m.631962 g.631962  ORF g.631962 m.631962 type:complete len:396 (+) comp22575_c0_seq14:503-1690(+)
MRGYSTFIERTTLLVPVISLWVSRLPCICLSVPCGAVYGSRAAHKKTLCNWTQLARMTFCNVSHPSTRVRCLQAVVSFTSLGYGDITPVTNGGRILASFWTLASTLQVAFITAIMFSNLQTEMSRAPGLILSNIQPPAKVAILNNSASATFATHFTGGGIDDVVVFSSFLDACTALIHGHVDSVVAEENTLKACFVNWQQTGKATGGLVISPIAEQAVETYYAVYNNSTACTLSNTAFLHDVATTLGSGMSTQTFVTQNYSTLASGTYIPQDTQSVSFSPVVIAASVFCVLATAVGVALALIFLARLMALGFRRGGGKPDNETHHADQLYDNLLPEREAPIEFNHLSSTHGDHTQANQQPGIESLLQQHRQQLDALLHRQHRETSSLLLDKTHTA